MTNGGGSANSASCRRRPTGLTGTLCADSRLVRVNLDNIDEKEECGELRSSGEASRCYLEQDLESLKEVRQEYLDSALKAKSKSRESEMMRGVRDKDRQIAWVEGKLRELGSDCDHSACPKYGNQCGGVMAKCRRLVRA